ncbi:MAG: hypothetical protein ACOX6E_04645 [Syntrophomonadaceae bacterium]|jgi:hypothetical protein
MQNFITSTLKLGHKVSMVLWLIDQYTSLGCNEEIKVYLNGRPSDFQRKAGGYLVFTDLEEDLYHIVLESQYYFTEQFEVSLSRLDRSEPIVYVPLKPAPQYRFNPGATVIRASLCNKKGDPLCGTLVTTLVSNNCARARIGRQGGKTGNSDIPLVDLTGRIAPGDLFLIRPAGKKSGEICEITTMGSSEGSYSLKQPLQSDHSRGELIMPLLVTPSDTRGEIVIGIRNLRQKTCQVEIQCQTENHNQIIRLEITTGLTHQLGKIVL